MSQQVGHEKGDNTRTTESWNNIQNWGCQITRHTGRIFHFLLSKTWTKTLAQVRKTTIQNWSREITLMLFLNNVSFKPKVRKQLWSVQNHWVKKHGVQFRHTLGLFVRPGPIYFNAFIIYPTEFWEVGCNNNWKSELTNWSST